MRGPEVQCTSGRKWEIAMAWKMSRKHQVQFWNWMWPTLIRRACTPVKLLILSLALTKVLTIKSKYQVQVYLQYNRQKYAIICLALQEFANDYSSSRGKQYRKGSNVTLECRIPDSTINYEGPIEVRWFYYYSEEEVIQGPLISFQDDGRIKRKSMTVLDNQKETVFTCRAMSGLGVVSK